LKVRSHDPDPLVRSLTRSQFTSVLSAPDASDQLVKLLVLNLYKTRVAFVLVVVDA
jgi:hypothetical protein